jgi:glycosyltransferase involved in cell wall biosynthesis
VQILEVGQMVDVLGADSHPRPPGRLLTVGVPVFNGKGLLRNCLRSVVDSTLPPDRFELLVVDDGSSEPETLAILAELEKELAWEPGFFRLLSLGTNSGGATA